MKKKHYLLILLFPLAVIIFNIYCIKMTGFFSFEMLSEHRKTLQDFVMNHPLITPLLYIAIYTVVTAFSVPGGIFMTITGGFLFPQPWSTIYTTIGATLGASLLFLAARTIFYDLLHDRVGPSIKKLRKGFQEGAPSYLLFLRLVPVFPFWLVNLAPAFFEVRLRTFVWTTFIGIIPGVFVSSQAGAGLGTIFDAESLTLQTIFNTNVQVAFLALGAVSLIPLIVRKIRKNHD